MRGKSTDSALARDILEWNVPEEVLAVLLKDRSTGRNLIWATDDYAAQIWQQPVLKFSKAKHDMIKLTQVVAEYGHPQPNLQVVKILEEC